MICVRSVTRIHWARPSSRAATSRASMQADTHYYLNARTLACMSFVLRALDLFYSVLMRTEMMTRIKVPNCLLALMTLSAVSWACKTRNTLESRESPYAGCTMPLDWERCASDMHSARRLFESRVSVLMMICLALPTLIPISLRACAPSESLYWAVGLVLHYSLICLRLCISVFAIHS